MVNIVNLTDFGNNLGTYIDKIVYQKEAFILTKGNKIVAKVIAANDTATKRKTSTSPFLKLVGLWSDIDVRRFNQSQKSLDDEDNKNQLLISR